MMVSNKGTVMGLLRWQSDAAILFVVMGGLVASAHELFDLHWATVPALPLTVVGAALGIFVSFRTNSAYDRWWEGRKLWGRLINTSRMWGTQVLAYLPHDERPTELQRTLVRRHIAYVHALRVGLRQQDPNEDEELLSYLGDDRDLIGQSNLNHALLQRQLDAVVALNDAGELDALRLQGFDESVKHLLDIQGGCERIKKTPLPRGYGFIAEVLIKVYSVLFPLGIAEELGWFVVPINLLVCMSLLLISEAGRVLEDPFSLFWNGLPLFAMSRTIAANLQERMDEAPPAIPKPDDRGILM